jgi:hypothetical protein
MTDTPKSDRERMIALAGPRNNIIDASARYGLSRNIPATDEQGRDVRLCLVVIERDNGAFELIGINEDRIRFQGESTITEEILRRVYA